MLVSGRVSEVVPPGLKCLKHQQQHLPPSSVEKADVSHIFSHERSLLIQAFQGLGLKDETIQTNKKAGIC